MSRTPFKRFAKKVEHSLEASAKLLSDEIISKIECDSLVLIELYSPLLQKVFSVGDFSGKVKYIVNITSEGELSVDAENKTLNFPVGIEDFIEDSEKYYASTFRGGVGIFDSRNEERLSYLPKLNNACRRFSYLIYIIPVGVVLPENIKNVPSERWRHYPLDVPGFNIHLLENRIAENRDCSECVRNVEPSFSEEGELSSEGNEEKGGRISPKIVEEKKEKSSSRRSKKEKVTFSEVPIEKNEYNQGLITFDEALKSLPNPHKSSKFPQLSKEWLLDFKEYISSLLSMFFGDVLSDEIKEKMLSRDALNIWLMAYISPIYDPNPDSNYNLLEFVGDADLKSAFTKYLTNRFPGIKESVLTELVHRYMSHEHQYLIGRKMNVKEWLLSDPKIRNIPPKIEEDVFEAFIGALSKVCWEHVLSGPGFSSVLVYSLIQKLWDTMSIDVKLMLGSDKTIIEQAARRYGWREEKGKPIHSEIIDPETGSKTYVTEYRIDGDGYLRFVRVIFDRLGKSWSEIPEVIYTRKEAATRTSADVAASSDILSQFERIGVTRADLTNDDIRTSQMYQNPEYTKLIDDVITKANSIGIRKLYIEAPKESTSGGEEFLMLTGVNQEGRLVKLFSSSFTRTYSQAKENSAELLREYLSS